MNTMQELLVKTQEATNKEGRQRAWARILKRFTRNQDEIVSFLKNLPLNERELAVNTLKHMPELSCYAAAVLWKETIDDDDQLQNVVPRKFRQMDNFSQFAVLKRLSRISDSEHMAFLVADLILEARIPRSARIVAINLKDSIASFHDSYEVVIGAYVAVIEAAAATLQ